MPKLTKRMTEMGGIGKHSQSVIKPSGDDGTPSSLNLVGELSSPATPGYNIDKYQEFSTTKDFKLKRQQTPSSSLSSQRSPTVKSKLPKVELFLPDSSQDKPNFVSEEEDDPDACIGIGLSQSVTQSEEGKERAIKESKDT